MAAPGHATKDKNFLKYMASLNRYPIMNKEEEAKVARLFVETGKAEYAHRLVTSNLKFVAKITYKYANTGHEMMDLIQEGNEGLMAAVRKFDPEKGYKLISYAVWWIKAYLNRYIISNHSSVKLGTTQAQRKLFFSMRSEKARLLAEKNGGEVTNEEMAELLSVQPHEIEEMEIRLAGRDFSLQSPLGLHSGDGDRTTFQDQLIDPNPDQSQVVENAMIADKIKELLTTLDLNAKERYIVQHRLMNTDPVTLQAIGERFSVSRERIRQIEANLKDKIRQAILREERKTPEIRAQKPSDLTDAHGTSTGVHDISSAQAQAE